MRLLVDLRPCRPANGLALDEALLDSLRNEGEEAVRLWVNERSIIVGRSQPVSTEVDVEAAERYDFPILRRVSGGGTVVHYPGNLNVSAVVSERPNWASVADAFARFGGALATGLTGLGRAFYALDNGVFANERKVGGAAQARRGRAILVHSTVMVQPCEVRFDMLLRAMRPGYEPTVPASRPQPVTSVSEVLGRRVDVCTVADAVLDGLRGELQWALSEAAPTDAETSSSIALAAGKYGRHEWNHRT